VVCLPWLLEHKSHLHRDIGRPPFQEPYGSSGVHTEEYMQEYFKELKLSRKQQALCKTAELAAMSDVEHQKQLLAVRRERFQAMVQLRNTGKTGNGIN
jgi:hypothetical protein